MSLKLLLLATFIAAASARCANQCSGHGQCGANDRCTCYAAWQGSDCSQRSCPHGNAWVDTASATDTAHNYAECSNRGVCDRKTGLCGCADGYTGMACARTTCPSDCSGHGTCETIAELAVDTSAAVGGKTHAVYGSWDADKTRGCKCDPRYSGHDCSSRMCPRGDDPLTTEVDISQTETTSLQVAEVQNVTVQTVNAPINGGQVTFTYTDLYNGVWTTRPVDLPLVKTWSTKTATSLQTSSFDWVTTGMHVTTFGTTLQLDTTTGESYVENTLNADVAAAVSQMQLRKGDIVQIGSADITAATSGSCMCRLYADVTSGTAGRVASGTAGSSLKCIVGSGVGGVKNLSPCKISAAVGATTTLVYSAWKALDTGDALDGATKAATAYDASTGIVTHAAAGTFAQAVSAATKSPLSAIIPGQWVRIYDYTATTDAYCDFQINAHPTTNAAFSVNPASATSTQVDASTGIGNSGGSSACTTFTSKTYAVATIENTQSLITVAGTPAKVFPEVTTAGDKWTTSVYNGVTTFTRYAAASTYTTAAPFLAVEQGAMQAGAIWHFYDDVSSSGASAIRFVCVCKISSYIADIVTNSFTCVDTGTIAGATFAQCSAAGTRAKAWGAGVVDSGNGVFFAPGSDDSANNPGYFTGLQSGDAVSLTNHNHNGRDDGVVFTIDEVDTTLGRAIWFKTGSAPNGGGMYPVMPIRTSIATSIRSAVAATAFPIGSIIQAYHTANCAANWCATDAATSNSAKDVARVLQELPNQVLADVTVAMTSNSLGLYAYSITFGGARNSGDQNEVIMNGKGCSVDGCQPRYSGVRTQTGFASKTIVMSTDKVTVTSGQMVASEDMSATGGEDIVVYQGGANNGKKFSVASTVDTVATFKYATGADVSTAAGSVLILKANGEYGVGNGGDAVADAATHRIQNFKSATYEITRGTTESTECSGRGNCDGETGLCECAEGYTGEACGTQSVLV